MGKIYGWSVRGAKGMSCLSRKFPRLEVPILLELKAVGGESRPRSLYHALTSYFPSLTPEDLKSRTGTTNRSRWRIRVQGAASRLAQRGEIQRTARAWRLTHAGKERAQREDMPVQFFLFSNRGPPDLSHNDIRRRLMKTGEMLGKYAPGGVTGRLQAL